MEESGFYTTVGFILAILFAAVMGLCMGAVLYTDFAASGGIVNERERVTLRIVATAAASAGIIAWWMQKFAAHRSFVIRLIYGLLIYMVIFAALGGLFQFGHGLMTNPGGIDFSLSGIYLASLGAFYTFAISLVGQAILALVGLLASAGIILAAGGPKKVY
jgi:hypothetical protein